MASCGGGAFACWLGWIEDGLVTAEDPAMLADDAAVLAEFDAVGPDRVLAARIATGRPTARALTGYLLVSKRTRQVLETVAGAPETARRLGVGRGTAWKPSIGPA